MRYRVMNLTRNTPLADQAARAESFMERFKGLMGVQDLPLGTPCTSRPATASTPSS